MLDNIKKTYTEVEELKGKDLAFFLVKIFVIFLVVGLGIGYINSLLLNKNEPAPVEPVTTQKVEEKPSYKGRVVYIDPSRYKSENIKYALEDTKGKEIILLSATDKKLEILEGLYTEVKGTQYKTKDGKNDVLLVSEVIMNASD